MTQTCRQPCALTRTLNDVPLSGSWPHAVHSAVTVLNCENMIKWRSPSCAEGRPPSGRVCRWRYVSSRIWGRSAASHHQKFSSTPGPCRAWHGSVPFPFQIKNQDRSAIINRSKRASIWHQLHKQHRAKYIYIFSNYVYISINKIISQNSGRLSSVTGANRQAGKLQYV